METLETFDKLYRLLHDNMYGGVLLYSRFISILEDIVKICYENNAIVKLYKSSFMKQPTLVRVGMGMENITVLIDLDYDGRKKYSDIRLMYRRKEGASMYYSFTIALCPNDVFALDLLKNIKSEECQCWFVLNGIDLWAQ